MIKLAFLLVIFVIYIIIVAIAQFFNILAGGVKAVANGIHNYNNELQKNNKINNKVVLTEEQAPHFYVGILTQSFESIITQISKYVDDNCQFIYYKDKETDEEEIKNFIKIELTFWQFLSLANTAPYNKPETMTLGLSIAHSLLIKDKYDLTVKDMVFVLTNRLKLYTGNYDYMTILQYTVIQDMAIHNIKQIIVLRNDIPSITEYNFYNIDLLEIIDITNSEIESFMSKLNNFVVQQ